MPIQQGDYVLLDYTLIDKETGQVIETTNEEVARNANIYRAEEVYRPALIIVGETKLFEPLEQALMSADEGSEVEVEVPPDKAYGQRDPSKVKVMSIREFHRHGIVPVPGDVVEIDGQRAKIVSVSGGRVTLDFNHPLAGKTLIVKARVVKVIRDPAEKIRQILLRHLPRVSEEKLEVVLQDGTATIKLPPELLLYERIGPAILQALSDVSARFQDVQRSIIQFQIEFKR